MDKADFIGGEGACLNCETQVSGKYCSNCGQKFQPTKLPLRIYLEDSVETLFNVDNRVFKTLKDLFLKPGKVTKDYIEGNRASYLPPLRIYISISFIYFLLAALSDSNQVFFINFGEDTTGMSEIAEKIQFALFFMVPYMALLIQLFYRKRKAFYVEYLIFAMHIHSIWFVLLCIELLTVYLQNFVPEDFSDPLYYPIFILSSASQLLTFGYLIMGLRRVFESSWGGAFAKAFGIILLYFLTLGFAGFSILFLFKS